jgi:hypothetical protein
VSSRSKNVIIYAAAACLLATGTAWSQYPGQVTKKSNDTPDLRAVAVLEWTGEPGKPKACRIVPVTVFDGERLQDGGIYLARPQPMALTSEVEYELKKNGKTIGLFEVKTAGKEQGSWVGHGDWKPAPKPKNDAAKPALVDADNDEFSDKPVLHRKHPADDPQGKTDSGSKAPAAPSDPDRPTLHKHDSKDSSPTAGPAPDPDRPTIHSKPSDDSASDTASGSAAPSDPDRPTLKKGKQKAPEEIGHVTSVAGVADPDRPMLKRGKSSGPGSEIAPTLMGLPPDMQQAVAVSDAKNRPDHPWTFSWANPDDEDKMKSQMEDMAREALGLSTPASKPKPVPRRPAAPGTVRKIAKPTPPPAPDPVPLEDEQFRVFELAYGSGATMVLTAHTSGALADEKFFTLIAQPDLYGNLRVLLKNVTDGAHLDQNPRMRLVDAVDAQADNRGELLFELRGDSSRQFALYRVLRGTAEKLFVSGGGFYGTASSE